MTGFFGFILRINRPFDKTYLSLQQKQHLCLILLLIIRLKESKVFRNIAVHKSSYPMNAIYTLTCTIILSVVAPLLRAQPQFSFQHLDTPGYDVRSFCQDSTGMIWLGTSAGLRSFADLDDDVFATHPIRQKLGIPIQQVQCDAAGRLWIWTDQKGLQVYDPHTDEIVEEAIDLLQSWGMVVWYNFEMLIDDDGRIWAWKDNSIYCYHPLTQELKQLTLDTFLEIPLEQGTYDWYIRDNRVYLFVAGYIYQLDTDSLQMIAKEPFPVDAFATSPLIWVDNQKNVWIALGNKLYYRNARTNDWSCPYETASYIKEIMQLNEQTICITTLSSGIYIFNTDGAYKDIYKYDPWETGSLQNNHILGIYKDNSENLYVSYNKQGLSICQLDYENENVRHLPSLKSSWIPDDINSIVVNPDGTLFVGTDGYGIYCLDATGKEKGEVLNDGMSVVTMLIDSKSRLWAGTFQKGVYCHMQGTVKHYLDQISKPLELIYTKPHEQS